MSTLFSDITSAVVPSTSVSLDEINLSAGKRKESLPPLPTAQLIVDSGLVKRPRVTQLDVVNSPECNPHDCPVFDFQDDVPVHIPDFLKTSLFHEHQREEQRGQPIEDLLSIQVHPTDPTKTTRIGALLMEDQRTKLQQFLMDNIDVFAWSHSDMPGIDPAFMVHQLRIDPAFRPIRQKRRLFNSERYDAIKMEVDKLLQAGFITEVHYPKWLSNVVLVKKSNGQWRLCVDFTDLNKACPKDSFPLPRIDQLVDSTAGHALLSFMDAYSGYNQIKMYAPDRQHTSFVTDRGLYCYTVMPFGLKNAGATYQRLVNKMFKDLLGRTMEVYVDDMLVKSIRADDHLVDLAGMFEVLRRHQMKLNPAKCAFGVASGKFLGYMVNQRGIEANPEKIQALLDMKSPSKVKEVQKLTGRIAALNRFVSKATDRCLPFFKALTGKQ